MNTLSFRFLCALLISLCETVLAATPMDVSTASGQGDRFILDILEASVDQHNESFSPPSESAAWISQKTPTKVIGFKPHGVWMRANLKNSSFQTIQSYVKVGKPYMDKVDCFVNSTGAEQDIYRMGDKTFFYSRPLPYKDFVIPIEMEAFSSKQLICFIKNDGATFADFQLWNPHLYQEAESLASAFRSLNYGAIAVAAMAGLFLGVWYRSWLFILLVADVIPSLLGGAALHSDGFDTIWPMSPAWNLPPYYWLYIGSLTVPLVIFSLIHLKKSEKIGLGIFASTALSIMLISIADPVFGTKFAPMGFIISFILAGMSFLICIRHHKDGSIPKVLALCLGIQIIGNLINATGVFYEKSFTPFEWDFQLAMLLSSTAKSLALIIVISLRLSEDRKNYIEIQKSHFKALDEKLSYEKQLIDLRSNHSKYKIPNQTTFQNSIEKLKIVDECCLSVWIIKLNRMDYLRSILPESHIVHALHDQVNNFGYALQHEYRDRLHKIKEDQYVAALDDSTLAFCTFGTADANMQHAVMNFWLKHQQQNDMFLAWSPYFGVAELSKAMASIDALSHAQIALITCSPQHRLQIFNPEQQSKRQRTFGITLDIEGAIERSELKLYYQPKVTLSHGGTESMEALARWQHPVQGMIPPDAFIPEAEATGAILKLTLWAIAHAADFLRSVDSPHLRIAINISAFDLASPHFANAVIQTLDRAKTPANRFIFEVTESTAIDDLPKTIAVLQTLRHAGAKIALDDFGTGYSSLGILEKLPIDELKIDRSFCQDLLESQQKKMLMQTMVELAKRMGFTVTAEGVESRDIVEWLRLHGCDTVQGYTFSKPLPEADALHWLAQAPQHPPQPPPTRHDPTYT